MASAPSSGAAALEAVAATRSRGVPRRLDYRMRRAAFSLMIEVQRKLMMDAFAPLVASFLFNQYYTTRTYALNDRFLVACTCLYLAGKIVDSPKAARDVFTASYDARRRGRAEAIARAKEQAGGAPSVREGLPVPAPPGDGTEPPPGAPSDAALAAAAAAEDDPSAALGERAFVDAARDRMFLAERAILYACGFELDVRVAYAPVLEVLGAAPQLAELRRRLPELLANRARETEAAAARARGAAEGARRPGRDVHGGPPGRPGGLRDGTRGGPPSPSPQPPAPSAHVVEDARLAWQALFEASMSLSRCAYASPMCVVRTPEAVAAAAVAAALRATGLDDLLPGPPTGGSPWWAEMVRSEEDLRALSAELVHLLRVRSEDGRRARAADGGEARGGESDDSDGDGWAAGSSGAHGASAGGRARAAGSETGTARDAGRPAGPDAPPPADRPRPGSSAELADYETLFDELR